MEQELNNLIIQGKIKVKFATVTLPVTATEGIPIGGSAGGKCIGIRLQLPIFRRNTTAIEPIPDEEQIIYYGDADSQEWELTAITTKDNTTPFLPCTDLNDIYVRGNGTANLVQVMIYHLA